MSDLEDGEIDIETVGIFAILTQEFSVTPTAHFGFLSNSDSSREESRFRGVSTIEEYEVLEKVGEGTFGEVLKAKHKATGRMVALKKILMKNEKEGFPITALREISILKQLKHPNVIPLIEMVTEKKTTRDIAVHMVFPFMNHDLAGILSHEEITLTLANIKYIAREMLSGLVYLHQGKFRILHRDIKGANILIGNNGEVKIGDFGLARPVDERRRNYTAGVVTRWYRPPELLLGSTKYNEKIDMWGFGCILAEMLTRKPILMGSSDFNQIEVICQLCGTPSRENWPDVESLPDWGKVSLPSCPRKLKDTFSTYDPMVVDLLDKLLTLDPKQRYSANESIRHDFFVSDPVPYPLKTLPSHSLHEYKKRKEERPTAAPSSSAKKPSYQPYKRNIQGERVTHPPSQPQPSAVYQDMSYIPQNPQYGSFAPQQPGSFDPYHHAYPVIPQPPHYYYAQQQYPYYPNGAPSYAPPAPPHQYGMEPQNPYSEDVPSGPQYPYYQA